ncbi:GTPase [Bythopirellula polymerisocia]|uniref:tRNA modification GTPase MnmE n=1 Tax=Bythopirellula polymerisocia TaxID=2528003 RepID=A0A5C6CZN6_9BACT|nr:GTPase [Bythopirellula polymerisocia]TWU30343.1 tRNA modification GTPase MnmE [Bythopirellula polymerisocia]
MTRSNGDDQTSVCVLTPTGRGAVAVVAVAGRDAVKFVDGCFLASNGRSLDRQPLSRIVYGHWGTVEGEDLVVCRRDEHEVEVHCHGGVQSVAAVVSQLVAAGCDEIPWQEWISRQHECPLEAEARIALAEATTSRTALILLDQLQGALRREVEAILAEIQSGEIAAAEARVDCLLANFSLGLHLTSPWQVVIAGRPNVGKSSLINALVGYQRAIVFDQPGTTRDVVTTHTVIDGWPIELSDTAGLHATTDSLEVAGIELAHAQLARADLVLWVEDATASDSMELLKQQASDLGLELPSRQVLVLNKIDLADQPIPANAIATSALTGQGIEHLLAAIVQQLVPDAPEPGSAVPFNMRQASLLLAAKEACEQGHQANASAALDELLVRGE